MKPLEQKIDFVAVISANMANCNGDPLNENRPRIDYSGYGEISDVCIKRKIRNRMQDMGYSIFVQAGDRSNDGFRTLKERADSVLRDLNSQADYRHKACEQWIDVRSFGQVFAYKGDKNAGVSIGIRGPVSIQHARSIYPVDIISMGITKSANNDATYGRAPDTMGMKYYVKHGMYLLKGSISPQLASLTGFSSEDALVLKQALRTLFCNDESAARPSGTMEVIKLFWFQHSCKDGQFSSAKVHRSVAVSLKNTKKIPQSSDDYLIQLMPLNGLSVQEIDGQ